MAKGVSARDKRVRSLIYCTACKHRRIAVRVVQRAPFPYAGMRQPIIWMNVCLRCRRGYVTMPGTAVTRKELHAALTHHDGQRRLERRGQTRLPL